MSATRPLHGKRIVVTRAIEQARGMKDFLEKRGATVLLLPAVSFSEPADATKLDRAIGSLDEFEWVLFTSANAVRFFSKHCRAVGRVIGEGQWPRLAAVGPVTASAAAAEGFTIDYVAMEFLGAALAKELSASVKGKRILLPRSGRAGHDLPDALRGAGASVTEVVAYHTGGVGVVEPGVMEALREARVDVVSFFSPSAVENIRGELGADVFSRLAAKAAFAAVGPVTATALRNAGVVVAIEAVEATTESMVAAIEKYFAMPKSSEARSQ
ncbi:MAG TPA: uroporphyrinogen-III synthase [Candidatus Dormibacteraeota bacterium]|nr:uroporphyrinogen-III synthase [Candidatus Dormibacteraeota bacterium]